MENLWSLFLCPFWLLSGSAEFCAEFHTFVLQAKQPMKTTYFLDTRGHANDGKGSVVLRIIHNNTSTTMGTGIRLFPDEWAGRVVNRPDAHELNLRLDSLKTSIDKAMSLLSLRDDFGRLTASQVKALMKEPKKDTQKHTLKSLFLEYMDSAGMAAGTRKIYNSTLLKVTEYAGESVTINDVDLKWLYGFEKFLSQTQGVNGRAIYLRDLRTICNYAMHLKLISVYPFDSFSIRTEPTKKRVIPVELLREFHDFPATDRQEMFRDYFFLMFYLIGINAADLFNAKKTDVIKGRLEYTRAKTHKRYSIKIEPEARAIIDRYSGTDYLVDAMERCAKYQDFLHMMNDSLGSIGRIEWEMIPDENNLFAAPRLEKTVVPIIPDITSYYARHTWATLAYEIGIPMDVISQALGHSNGNKTTLIYVKQGNERVDEANRAVIDYFTKPFAR